MNKLGRKLSALFLAAAVAVSTVSPAFAANGSPTQGQPVGTPVAGDAANSKSTVSGYVDGEKTMTVTKVNAKGSTAKVPSYLKASNGQTYDVDVIATGTISKKYKKVTLVLNPTTKVQAKVAKSKKAKKTKKIVIKASKADKSVKASQFSKKAFKGFKGKIVVKKSAMTRKQFKKLVKKLRKGGFKGKIVYKE